MHAFDIHCNGFVPLYFFLGTVQYIMLPFLIYETYFSTFLSNCIYLVGLLYYFYVVLLGFYCKSYFNIALPFVKKNRFITSMICKNYLILGPIIIFFCLLTLLNFNLTQFILGTLLGGVFN
jgi:hypothetical protein